jgi:hypothetical protein
VVVVPELCDAVVRVGTGHGPEQARLVRLFIIYVDRLVIAIDHMDHLFFPDQLHIDDLLKDTIYKFHLLTCFLFSFGLSLHLSQECLFIFVFICLPLLAEWQSLLRFAGFLFGLDDDLLENDSTLNVHHLDLALGRGRVDFAMTFILINAVSRAVWQFEEILVQDCEAALLGVEQF